MTKLKNLSILMLFIFSIVGCKKTDQSKKINIEDLTIAKIHKAYEQGIYNSQDLVAAYLSAIKEKNKTINALSIINPKALSIAKALDADYQKTKRLLPLQGIPIVIKDNINAVGLATTAGSLALHNFIPKENAFVINKLVAAGAIIIAKSNMAEWAFSAKHTKSSTVGTTLNPYNLAYVPAGSSGGTAAAVASNLALGGLGTDTGNSIRGPSSHCDLVGFRTTMGLISREGIVPLTLRNDIVGPMCRTVADATKMMQVMVGYDPKDSVTKNSINKHPKNYTQFLIKNGLKGARIGVLRALSDYKTDPNVKNLFEKALSDLDSLGASVVDPVVIPNFDNLRKKLFCTSFRTDVESFLETYVKNDTVKTIEDIIRIGTKSNFARKILAKEAKISGRSGAPSTKCLNTYQDVKLIAFREAIEATMDSLNLDAIVYPTWNDKPARSAYFEKEYKGDNSQIIAPHTGQPAFTVPMGFSPGNLPAGLQFLGSMYDEPTLIKLAYAYEQGTTHRKPPALNKKEITDAKNEQVH
jgi:amidase